jgi:hypothetical protein
MNATPQSITKAVTATATEARWHDDDELRWAVRHWATRIGVRTPQIHLRRMKHKWASISTAGRLTLDSSLLSIPKPLVDCRVSF